MKLENSDLEGGKAVKPVVKKVVLKNGLTLIVDEAPYLKSVNLAAWIKTGSRHEDLENWGMCHFLEHMLFKGTDRKGAGDISKAVDRVGGDFNAFTSREHTCFHFYLPATELKLGVGLLKEILYRPLFDQKELDRERQVILQEIAMVKESPEEELFDFAMEKVFEGHSLGRQILGSKKSIENTTRKSMFRFFYQHYRPENIVIAVSGAIKFEQVRRLVSQLEGSWPERKKPQRLKAHWGVQPPEKFASGVTWVEAPTEQCHLVWILNSPVRGMKDRIIAQLIQQHLGGGMSSVLFDQIREKKGWAYTVYSQAIQFFDASLFATYAAVKPERALETLRLIRKEMNRIAAKGIARQDLGRIKESILNSFELSLENTEARMMTISHQELFYKRPFSILEYEKTLQGIKPKEVSDLMRTWLQQSAPLVCVMSPKPRGLKWSELNHWAIQATGQSLKKEKATSS